MKAMHRAMTAYGHAAETLPAIQQIVLLYDGAIRRIKEARGAIEERRVNDRFVAITKAAAIIDALQAALDHERGGEIAHSLDRLYGYVGFRLQSLNLGPDTAICDELIERLGELRTSWAALAEGSSLRAPADFGPRRDPAPGTDPGIQVTA